MLTKQKVVLLVPPEVIDELSYEGLKRIETISQVTDTWEHNKTPMVVKGTILEQECRIRYLNSCVEVSEHLSSEFIQFAHSKGFEPGEFITGAKYDTASESCFLCKFAEQQREMGVELYNATTLKESAVTIYDSEHFFVDIELGCMTPGMLMINPKEHILSVALLPKEQLEEYYSVMKDIEFLLKAVYGPKPVIFFEHGSASDGFSTHKRSIVHAHTHVAWGVPFAEKYLDMVCLKPTILEELKGSKYLSYQDGTKGQFLAVSDPEVFVQRQYPRQVIAEMLGIPNEQSNWRIEPFNDNIHKTYMDFWIYLKHNSSFLSPRLVKATEGFVKGYEKRIDFNE